VKPLLAVKQLSNHFNFRDLLITISNYLFRKNIKVGYLVETIEENCFFCVVRPYQQQNNRIMRSVSKQRLCKHT
jgi:hypothetical protein